VEVQPQPETTENNVIVPTQSSIRINTKWKSKGICKQRRLACTVEKKLTYLKQETGR